MKDIQYNEKKQHGATEFPIQHYFVDNAHPQYVMPLHWHGEFELIRVIRGEFLLYIDNREILLKQGDIAVIDCTAMHRGTPCECEYECLVFSLGMLTKKSNDIVRKYLRPISHHSVDIADLVTKESAPKTFLTASKLFDTVKTGGDYYELTVHKLLFELFESVYSENLVSVSTSRQKNERQLKTMTELLGWIDENYSENITLADLSRVAGMNEKYLCRFFKEYTGKTPVDYINFLRIESACHELTHGGMNVTDASLECGFNSLSYFTKTFKKYKQMTPGEYLRRYKTGL